METVLRVVFVYIFVWACFRIVGKRELSQMAPFELVMLLFVPQFFSRALTRQDYSMINALTASTTLFSLVVLTSIISFRSAHFRRFMESHPTVLVKSGQFVGAGLGKERIAAEEVFAAMHKAGVEKIEDVKWAILEADGKIAIIRTDQGPVHQETESGRGGRS
jgi:uncharacterized membrane protein YcaP (DUF421 family)